MNRVQVIGGGPAGAAAALAALSENSPVVLCERSSFPRHKVCGEFLSPEIAGVLDRLGVLGRFEEARPAAIRRVNLHFGKREKRWTLAEPGFGLSRYALDSLLMESAVRAGATLCRESASPDREPVVVASGRQLTSSKGARLFGFKAHFDGPVDDSVNLFFFGRCYVGISSVENARTNVCGLAPEPLLRSLDFDIDRLVRSSPQLAERLSPLERLMKWRIAGPLVFGENLQVLTGENIYPAGDRAAFIDPFTGSGILAALTTGGMAGRAAARRLSATKFRDDCRRVLRFQFAAAGALRTVLASGWGDHAATWIPGKLLFLLTRPLLLTT